MKLNKNINSSKFNTNKAIESCKEYDGCVKHAMESGNMSKTDAIQGCEESIKASYLNSITNKTNMKTRRQAVRNEASVKKMKKIFEEIRKKKHKECINHYTIKSGLNEKIALKKCEAKNQYIKSIENNNEEKANKERAEAERNAKAVRQAAENAAKRKEDENKKYTEDVYLALKSMHGKTENTNFNKLKRTLNILLDMENDITPGIIETDLFEENLNTKNDIRKYIEKIEKSKFKSKNRKSIVATTTRQPFLSQIEDLGKSKFNNGKGSVKTKQKNRQNATQKGKPLTLLEQIIQGKKLKSTNNKSKTARQKEANAKANAERKEANAARAIAERQNEAKRQANAEEAERKEAARAIAERQKEANAETARQKEANAQRKANAETERKKTEAKAEANAEEAKRKKIANAEEAARQRQENEAKRQANAEEAERKEAARAIAERQEEAERQRQENEAKQRAENEAKKAKKAENEEKANAEERQRQERQRANEANPAEKARATLDYRKKINDMLTHFAKNYKGRKTELTPGKSEARTELSNLLDMEIDIKPFSIEYINKSKIKKIIKFDTKEKIRKFIK